MSQQAFVRMEADLADACARAAAGQGLTVAAWLRSLAVAKVGMSADAVRPSAPPALPDPFVAELGALSRTVSRLNGALVQMTKAARETGHPAHAEAEAVLADMRSLGRQLTDAVEEARRDRRRDPR